MKKLDNKAIIGRFMNKEIEVIYKKYLKMSDDEEALIGNFIRKLEEGKVDFFDPYLNYENTKTLAKVLQGVEDIDVIKLYIFLASDLQLTGIDAEDARDYHEELVETGYKQIGDYLLYDAHGESQLEAKVEEALVYDFEEPDRVLDLFSADELAEMWIFRTSFEEAASNLLEDESWAEIMEFEYLGTAFFNELIKLLRSEFEHTEEYNGKVESQWLMGVSLRQKTSAEYLVRVTVKTSESPYIDGMDIKLSLDDGDKLQLEDDYFENTPELLGSPEEDAINWLRKLGELIYLQLEKYK